MTEYNSISYFADGDTVSGFHYELLNAFARSKGLTPEIIPEMSFEKMTGRHINRKSTTYWQTAP